MVLNKSLDNSKVIAALLHDIHNAHGSVFNTRSVRLTLNKVNNRLRHEGIGFLTKTLPSLGKAFDKALSGNTKLNSASHGFESMPNSELPRFLGEFFSRVLQSDGSLLRDPCAASVSVIRQVCYLFYKYKLPYTDEQEQQVIQKFTKTEEDLAAVEEKLQGIGTFLQNQDPCSRRHRTSSQEVVTREAKILLSNLFSSFDPLNISPRHGPGVVATKQRLEAKFRWSNVSSRITDLYPFDAYFCASPGHVCDTYQSFNKIGGLSLSARVLLVPKDSRGPRLISCEPVDYQWIQQGLGRALVAHVENHTLTKCLVNFTHQYPNRCGALLGSRNGKYSTLDLAEASDRVSTALVRLLFPEHIRVFLEACRTSSTVLPDGTVLELKKFAPMGSALCFPILAITIWAILTAAAPDKYTRDRILVYGDDVIVPTAYAANAIEQLESFGLKVNRDKSCTGGLFRESCGADAFNGIDVTPVRLRTVWSSDPSPDVYCSWISYANSFYDRRYYRIYDLIVENLVNVYGPIPDESMNLSCPSLRSVPYGVDKFRRRVNTALQKVEYHVLDVTCPSVKRWMTGWEKLLRYFSETAIPIPSSSDDKHQSSRVPLYSGSQRDVSSYTSRRTSMLVRRWR